MIQQNVLSHNLKKDVVASIVVFLVAIPLCLGIALACGAPIFSGILTGIIGGIVVGLLSESQVSVSGPAAGMIAVVIAALTQLGGFAPFLLALLIAGILQIIIGMLRAGFIADYVPSNVIQGLLTAIGILIIIKQIPLAFGYFPGTEALQASLQEAQENFSVVPLLGLMQHINIGVTIISIISLVLLATWEKLPFKFVKFVPAAIVVVIIAVLLSKLFYLFPSIQLNKTDLINFPVNGSVAGFLSNFKHPQFSAWQNLNIYLYAVMIAIVASVETLLNLEAAEKLDKKHRYCSRNRELIAQGVGNTISGLLGGLPITSVIIRTSVNINMDAQTKMSAVFHGALLLISLLFFPQLLNHIPIAALAAVLIYTGYKLAHWKVFKQIYQTGMVYFIPFIVTVFAIVFTNLLLGIIIGLAVSAFFILRYNSKRRFVIVQEKHPSGEILRLILPEQLSFLNKAAIIASFKRLPKNSRVIIDASNSVYIDNDILTTIKEFSDSEAINKNILLNLEGFHAHYTINNQTKFIPVTTYDVQETLTPASVLQILQEGNQRFINNTLIHKNFRQQIKATSQSQHPLAVIFGCIDSRVPVELIFDMNVGDVFVVRVAGNVPDVDVLASIEFACEVAGAKLIVILGHTGCGAIKAACDGVKLGHVTELIQKIKPAIEMETTTQHDRNGDNAAFVNHVVSNNVNLTKNYILERSQILQKLINAGAVGMVGALYDVAQGTVAFEALSVPSTTVSETEKTLAKDPNLNSSWDAKPV